MFICLEMKLIMIRFYSLKVLKLMLNCSLHLFHGFFLCGQTPKCVVTFVLKILAVVYNMYQNINAAPIGKKIKR